MRVGILTFHWAANYGAVLQAFALEKAFEKYGCDTKIIDYYPAKYKKTIRNCFYTRHPKRIVQNFAELKKEKKIAAFRAKYLNRTAYIRTKQELAKKAGDFDCYVCGSDQIWNPSFVQHAEPGKTFAYFLDFAKHGIRCAYAASFGVTAYPEHLQVDIQKHLQAMRHVSVREKSGQEIVQGLGIAACEMVCDPTVLWTGDMYTKLLSDTAVPAEEKYAFVYMLHGRTGDAKAVLECIQDAPCNIQYAQNTFSIEDWLQHIRCAEYVVTNSFHGVVFSILFHVPFYAVLIQNSPMNDRLYTLLNAVGLEDRIVTVGTGFQTGIIDWDAVDVKMEAFRQSGYQFIEKILKSME